MSLQLTALEQPSPTRTYKLLLLPFQLVPPRELTNLSKMALAYDTQVLEVFFFHDEFLDFFHSRLVYDGGSMPHAQSTETMQRTPAFSKCTYVLHAHFLRNLATFRSFANELLWHSWYTARRASSAQS